MSSLCSHWSLLLSEQFPSGLHPADNDRAKLTTVPPSIPLRAHCCLLIDCSRLEASLL